MNYYGYDLFFGNASKKKIGKIAVELANLLSAMSGAVLHSIDYKNNVIVFKCDKTATDILGAQRVLRKLREVVDGVALKLNVQYMGAELYMLDLL